LKPKERAFFTFREDKVSSKTASSMTSNLELKSYFEDKDFRAEGKPEPNRRSQTLIYRLQDKKWWIRVSLQGAVSSLTQNSQPDQPQLKRERRNELQELVRMINFQSLALLDDTVTELVLNQGTNPIEAINLHLKLEDSNRLTKVIKHL
jgi:Asp-tRNA(Asn)/Glu-tRNA(Gln) amidotransferase B subunit